MVNKDMKQVCLKDWWVLNVLVYVLKVLVYVFLETLWSSRQVEVDVASRHSSQIYIKADVCMMMISTF